MLVRIMSDDLHEPGKRSIRAPKRRDQSGHTFGVD
jgi:hypothetical protein